MSFLTFPSSDKTVAAFASVSNYAEVMGLEDIVAARLSRAGNLTPQGVALVLYAAVEEFVQSSGGNYALRANTYLRMPEIIMALVPNDIPLAEKVAIYFLGLTQMQYTSLLGLTHRGDRKMVHGSDLWVNGKGEVALKVLPLVSDDRSEPLCQLVRIEEYLPWSVAGLTVTATRHWAATLMVAEDSKIFWSLERQPTYGEHQLSAHILEAEFPYNQPYAELIMEYLRLWFAGRGLAASERAVPFGIHSWVPERV